MSSLLFFVLGRVTSPPAPGPTATRRTSILIQGADVYRERLTSARISPDGNTLAFLARADGKTQIHVRPIDRMQTRPLLGTENAIALFFSPNSRWLGFFSVEGNETGAIKRVSLDDGRVQHICAADQFFGASWGPDNSIVYAGAHGLLRVGASGGLPESVSVPDIDKGEFSHRYPHLLPDGRNVIFTIGTGGDFDSAQIAMLDLSSGEQRTIIDGGSAARYLSSGHIVYVRGGELTVAQFDLGTMQATGPSIPLADPIQTDSLLGFAGFSVSNTGTLVYPAFDPSSSQSRRLVWVDRDGRQSAIGIQGQAFRNPRISPNGKRLAVVVAAGSRNDIWIYDLEHPLWRGTGSQLKATTSTRSGRMTDAGSISARTATARSTSSAN